MRTLVLMAAVLAACTRPASVPPADGGAQEERVIGVPASVGSAPMNVRTVVAAEGGGSVYVTGPLAAEIRSLSAGARVEVRGRRAADRTLVASDYDVLSVNGRPVFVGVVERANDGALQLHTRTGLVRLQDAPAAFRPGMKVWVQGPGSVTVQTYGVIRS
ncbi:MAG TPA: hypothetical protein VF647_16245 [Longimicrobium sp.]|jgi:hypothetical protein